MIPVATRGTRRRTVAPPADRVPTATLAHRFRADSITGLADGAAVASWPAKVGGQTFAQATAASQPAWAASAVNSKPAVRWPSAVNIKFMSSSGLGTLNQGYTVAAVVKNTTISDNLHLFAWNTELQINASKWTLYGGANLSEASNAPANTWQIVVGIFNGGTSAIWRNGTQTATGTGGGVQATGTFNLGQRSDGVRQWEGDIAEVFVFSSALTNAQLVQLDSYAQDYYGITVADYAAA